MTSNTLVRDVGLLGAVMMGLGSIVGTGVFASLGLSAGLAGTSMLFALFVAGLLAVCNGLSTAQLAAAHPVSGGTYEYGYRFLSPWWGFFAGWLFLCAKSASAATAAIAFGGYFLQMFSIEGLAPWQIGICVVIGMVVTALFGIRRSNTTNIAIVSLTLVSLAVYMVSVGSEFSLERLMPFLLNSPGEKSNWAGFFESIALLFVAYTGYGRVATLGEEIKNPERNIPRAVVYTLVISFALYLAVAVVSLGAVGASDYYEATVRTSAPLEIIAHRTGHMLTARLLAVGAMSAMLGVLLNLILGLSRVLLAMGRKRDLPNFFTAVDSKHRAPYAGIIASGVIIIGLVFLKEVKTTWSLSAFTVLFYYAITNAAALRLPPEKRLYSRVFAWVGLLGCLFVSCWVDSQAFISGFAMLIVGYFWRRRQICYPVKGE